MKRFEFIVTFIISYVTCGIYTLYMWYQMAKANNEIARQNGKETIMDFIPAYLIGCVTCGIFLIYWYYKFFNQQVELQKLYGVKSEPTDNPILLILLTFVPVYSYYVICDNYNRTADAFEGK